MAVVAGVLLARDGRHEVEVDPRPVDVARASPAEASAALSDFVAGVRSRDAQALAELAPDDRSGAEDVLTGIAANAESLDLQGVTARYVDQVGAVAADGSWSGVAELTWRFGGFDRSPARTDVVVSFVPDDDGVAIAGFGNGDHTSHAVPLWLRGALSVVRADDVLVMVDGDAGEARVVAARVRRGIPVVQRVLPDWAGPVVVEVPAGAADLDETLGAAPGTYAGIAAVTAAAGDTSTEGAPVHVFVNPGVTDGLRRAGAQVVMSHELVHVATDAARTPMEPWLLEGFADYVALRDTRLPDRTTLGRAIEAARTGGTPDALPTAADFDTRAEGLQARYEEAWMACRILAEQLGERGLVRVYEDVAGGRSTERALRRAGTSTALLTEAWRDRIDALVG